MPKIDFVNFIPLTSSEEMAKKINLRQEKRLECQLKCIDNEERYTKNTLTKSNVALKNAIDQFYLDTQSCITYMDNDGNIQLNRMKRSNSKPDLKTTRLTMMSNSSAHRIFHKDSIDARNKHKRLIRSASDPAIQVKINPGLPRNHSCSFPTKMLSLDSVEQDANPFTDTTSSSKTGSSSSNGFLPHSQSGQIASSKTIIRPLSFPSPKVSNKDLNIRHINTTNVQQLLKPKQISLLSPELKPKHNRIKRSSSLPYGALTNQKERKNDDIIEENDLSSLEKLHTHDSIASCHKVSKSEDTKQYLAHYQDDKTRSSKNKNNVALARRYALSNTMYNKQLQDYVMQSHDYGRVNNSRDDGCIENTKIQNLDLQMKHRGLSATKSSDH